MMRTMERQDLRRMSDTWRTRWCQLGRSQWHPPWSAPRHMDQRMLVLHQGNCGQDPRIGPQHHTRTQFASRQQYVHTLALPKINLLRIRCHGHVVLLEKGPNKQHFSVGTGFFYWKRTGEKGPARNGVRSDFKIKNTKTPLAKTSGV
jgi:hypothetical protein